MENYQLEVSKRFKDLVDENVDETWNNIKQNITEVSLKVLEKVKKLVRRGKICKKRLSTDHAIPGG